MREGNPLVATVLFTPYAPLIKMLPLAFLAALTISSTRCGRPSPRRLVRVALGLVIVYIAIVVNNLALALRLA